MPLETGTVISDLVVTNPAHTDGLAQADSHIKLLKSTIKNTFPNVNAPISSTDEQIDGAVSATANGSGVLKDTGEFFKTNSFDGITNPSAGQVAIVAKNAGGTASVAVVTVHGDTLATNLAGDVTAAGNASVSGNATITGNETVTGNLTVTGKILGPGSVPIGGMIMWLDDTLPTDGNWCWANGGSLSRTTVGAGKELFDKWGTRYGSGNGSTTFNVIDMQEVVPVGKSTMGGGVSPGFLASIGSGKATLGSEFGNDTTTLVTLNLPPYTPSGSVSTTVGGAYTYAINPSSNGPLGYGGTASGATISTLNGALSSSFSGTTQGGTSTPFSNLGPRRVVGFIIRIA